MSINKRDNLTQMPQDNSFLYDTFTDGRVLYGKRKYHLPAMGWNSWNAFGSGNTEALTKQIADKLVELELDKLGYKYVVLDDGCYKPERVDSKLSNEEVKFPSGFRALADYIHARGLKFGMYNDIGTNLCAGAAVGTCGHESEDASSYIDWDVDFLKVDNCYYLWDNATFSDPTNAKYVFAPNIRSITVNGQHLSVVSDGVITGTRAYIVDNYVTFIGTYDGTGPDHTPVGCQSSELEFHVTVEETGSYDLVLEYATGAQEGVGSFVQIGIRSDESTESDIELVYDDFVPSTDDPTSFVQSDAIKVNLSAGSNTIRIMNHRRQENTLGSYATLVEQLQTQAPDKDIILSICEWGKTSPQNWGYKIGDSWRILNDITFQVGTDGDPGVGAWNSDYTTSIAAQYNKTVVMDEYAGLDKGWNDPDMMMIGMNGLNLTQCKTHMTMWCMMNSPLMLGMDLRRVSKGDDIWQIISNYKMIALNQDKLGIQAKRVYSSMAQTSEPDKEYIRDIHRLDILAKPLAGGNFAISFINMDDTNYSEPVSIPIKQVLECIGKSMDQQIPPQTKFQIVNLWTDEVEVLMAGVDSDITIDSLGPCDSITMKTVRF